MCHDDKPIPISITDVFDLHTVQAKDVQEVVEAYLEEANRLGFKALRIIHGRGIEYSGKSCVLCWLARRLSLLPRRPPRSRELGGYHRDPALAWAEQAGSPLQRALRVDLLSPLLLFNAEGDCLTVKLRPGNVHSAEGWEEVQTRLTVAFPTGQMYAAERRRSAKFSSHGNT